ncbi:hypothetical protein [Candidatus Uabimicrobium amorphum]|uniref:Uncharacterized protein n=1 Tax=Uabimicrobium amorphum TaxID=2596890 RepID=A0A5S9F566_UABAM|nr:hypothetical protein [Candidatus Uabimicrobium amorphum]BBM85981.1 hypothetical protein UABAM_04367 [Candidatus Uabimicrobium amorphum]
MNFFDNHNVTLIDKLIVFAYRNKGMTPEEVIRAVGCEGHIHYYNGYWTQYGEEIIVTRTEYQRVLQQYNIKEERLRSNVRSLSATNRISSKLFVLEREVQAVIACINRDFSMQLTFNAKNGREVVRISRKGTHTWIHLNEKENDWLEDITELSGWQKNGTYWTKTVQNFIYSAV